MKRSNSSLSKQKLKAWYSITDVPTTAKLNELKHRINDSYPDSLCCRCYIINFIVRVSSYFLQSTLHCSCSILFPSVQTSLIMFHFYFLQSTGHLIHSPNTIHLVHINLIWLYSYYMVVQPYCQFHFPANPVSGN